MELTLFSNDVLLHIVLHLDAKSLHRLRLSCNRFLNLLLSLNYKSMLKSRIKTWLILDDYSIPELENLLYIYETQLPYRFNRKNVIDEDSNTAVLTGDEIVYIDGFYGTAYLISMDQYTISRFNVYGQDIGDTVKQISSDKFVVLNSQGDIIWTRRGVVTKLPIDNIISAKMDASGYLILLNKQGKVSIYNYHLELLMQIPINNIVQIIVNDGDNILLNKNGEIYINTNYDRIESYQRWDIKLYIIFIFDVSIDYGNIAYFLIDNNYHVYSTKNILEPNKDKQIVKWSGLYIFSDIIKINCYTTKNNRECPQFWKQDGSVVRYESSWWNEHTTFKHF